MDTQKERSEFELILELLKHWLSRWYYFVISFVICLVIGALMYKLAVPQYKISSSVALRAEDSGGGFAGMSLMKSLGFGKSSPGSNVQDEALMMKSHGPLKKLVKELKLNNNYTLYKKMGIQKRRLYKETPLEVSYDENLPDTLGGGISMKVSANGEQLTVKVKYNKIKMGAFKLEKLPASIQTECGSFTFFPTSFYNAYGKSFDLKIDILNSNLQAEICQGMVEVEEEKKSSDIINMNMVSDNIGYAQVILEGIVRNHNKESASEKDLVGKQTLEFVNDRLQEVGKELDEADSQIQLFKEKYKLTDIEIDAEALMQQTTELMPVMIESQSQLQSIALLDSYLSDSKNKFNQIPLVVMSTGSEELMKAISMYNEELSKREELLQSEKKETGVSRNITNKLTSSRDNLLLAMTNAKKGLEITVNNLKKKENELLSRMKDVPVMEKSYIALKRNQEVKQAVYIYLQQKKEETSVTSVAVTPKLRVIDEPYPMSKAVSPSLFKIALLVVFFGGVLIPLVLIYAEPILVQYLRNRRNKNA